MVKIDAHVHLGSITDKKKKWGSFEEYKKIIKKLDIFNYCVVPIGLPNNFTEKSTPNNDAVLNELENNSDLIPVYWFNVFDFPKKIDKKYKAIKLHSDIGNISIGDKRVVNFVNKLSLPIFVHTNENKDFSNLSSVSDLAKKVDVLVIAVHSGSVIKTFFKLDDYEFPENVYFETSGIQYSIILKKIYKKFGADRIVFGSDYPFGDLRVSLAMIDSLETSEKEYNLITNKNIRKIMKI